MTITKSSTLADLFHHIALAEILVAMRPHEYWESHSPGTTLHLSDPRAWDVFAAAAHATESLNANSYIRLLPAKSPVQSPPSSAALAHHLLLSTARRLLFCAVEAEGLHQIHALAANAPVVECVQDDGVGVLRGATLILPAQWAASTCAFLNPPDPHAPTDAGISPMELWCELANRGIAALLAYRFADTAEQISQSQARTKALEKALLLNRGAQQYEGIASTHAGFGLLAINLSSIATFRLDKSLRALESLAAKIPPTFKYACKAV